jgi:hypothetical protein
MKLDRVKQLNTHRIEVHAWHVWLISDTAQTHPVPQVEYNQRDDGHDGRPRHLARDNQHADHGDVHGQAHPDEERKEEVDVRLIRRRLRDT